MVSDGMSFGTLSLADMYSRLTRQQQTHWLRLLTQPGVRRGLFRTESFDSPVTDSAAAGSAWGCGHKVRNGSINITEDGTQRVPLLIQAAQSGKATGLVTTARVTHATPAAFIANIPRRDWEGYIAQQMLERPCDVILGGGARFFPPSLLGRHSEARVIRTRSDLLSPAPADEKRLVGLFSEYHVPFVLDRGPEVPSLTEMTRAALSRLAGRPEGFVMQVEGGRIDHAAHSNDAASLVREQLDFDDAIAEVLQFVKDRDDTLVILTTDHGNANPGLTIYGARGQEAFARLPNARHSFEWIKERLADIGSIDGRAERAPGLLEEAVGLDLAPEEAEIIVQSFRGKRTSPFLELCTWDTVMGGVAANHFGVGFVSGNHTSDMIEVTAFGPGSEDLPAIGHNADLHPLLAGALALAPGKPLDGMEDRIEFPPPPAND